jgi:hypothetical protein
MNYLTIMLTEGKPSTEIVLSWHHHDATITPSQRKNRIKLD